MSEGGYKIRDQYGMYYLTFTVIDWIDVFTRKCYRDMLIDSLEYCQKEKEMPGSAYQLIEFVGTSKESWENAAKNAVEAARKQYSDLRVATVTEMDMTIEGERVSTFRVKLNISFKCHL